MAISYSITGFGSDSNFILPIGTSTRRLIRALSKIDGFVLRKKKSWWLSGDFHCVFEIRGVLFEIETPLSDYCISAIEKSCPEEMLKERKSSLDARESWFHKLFIF